MKTNGKLTGLALAVSAAALFATACNAAEPPAEQGKVKCENSTACKGHSKCSTATNSCAGQNSCKGVGWTEQKSEADCKAAQEAAKKT
jgi:hypothetical protein